jgi:NAD(P)-dependent dehydrogenase (short-subunit alcohol dehydrogenase family)
MAGRLDGRVALITGGASGIGGATARLFASEGAKLVLADLQAQQGEALARELNSAIFARTDVTREDEVAAAVDRAVAEFGRLDCLINNAGIVGASGPIAAIAAEDWTATLAVLLDGTFFGMKHAARVMVPQGSGVILSTSSVAGIAGGFGQHAYTAAKHAVVGLTRSVAAELAPVGIRVNTVAPGGVPTPMTANLRGVDMDAARKSAAEMSPMGTAVEAEDIAAAFLFLASEEARNVTGQVLVVDGGLTGFARPKKH